MYSCCTYFMTTDSALFWTSDLKEVEKGTLHIQEKNNLQMTGVNIFLVYF